MDEFCSSYIAPTRDMYHYADADDAKSTGSQKTTWTSPGTVGPHLNSDVPYSPRSCDTLPYSVIGSTATLTRTFVDSAENWSHASTRNTDTLAIAPQHQPQRRLWPPHPLVEDEKISLAKELNPLRGLDSEANGSQIRGLLEQQPIILDAMTLIGHISEAEFYTPLECMQKRNGGNEDGKACFPYLDTSPETPHTRVKPHMKLNLEDVGSISLDRRTPSPYTFTPKPSTSICFESADSGYFPLGQTTTKSSQEQLLSRTTFREGECSHALRGKGKSRNSISHRPNSKGPAKGDLIVSEDETGQTHYQPRTNRSRTTLKYLAGKGKDEKFSGSAGRPERGRELGSTQADLDAPQARDTPIKNSHERPKTPISVHFSSRGESAKSSPVGNPTPISTPGDYFGAAHKTFTDRSEMKSTRVYDDNLRTHPKTTRPPVSKIFYPPGLSREGSKKSSPSSSQCARTVDKPPAPSSSSVDLVGQPLRTYAEPKSIVSVRSSSHTASQTIIDRLPYPLTESGLIPKEEHHAPSLKSIPNHWGWSGKSMSLSKPTDSVFRAHQEVRPAIVCPMDNSDLSPEGWYTFSSLNICSKCWEYYFGDSNYAEQFRFQPWDDDNASRACDMASPWMQVTWTHAVNMHGAAPDAILEQAQISVAQAPCPGKHRGVRDWFTLPAGKDDVIEGFDVCPCDKTRLETLMPSLKGQFRISHASKGQRRRCDFRTNSARFGKYMSLLVKVDAGILFEIDGSPTFKDFVQLAQLKAGTQECPRDNVVFDRRWHFLSQLPELHICEDCYTEVVWPAIEEGWSLARHIDQTPRYMPEEASRSRIRSNHSMLGATCQLFSKRMRKIWSHALQHNDFAYLQQKVLERRKREIEMRQQCAVLEKSLLNLETRDPLTRCETVRLHSELEKVVNYWRMWQ